MSQNFQDPNAVYRQTPYAQPYYHPAQEAMNAQRQPMMGAQQGTYSGGAMPQIGPMGQPPQMPQMQPMFPSIPSGASLPPAGMPAPLNPQVPGVQPLEQSSIEHILRLNKGKLVTVYATYDGNHNEGLARTFKGVIEAAGKDHLILSDPQTGQRYLIPMMFFAYAVFDEELEYDYPDFTPGLSR